MQKVEGANEALTTLIGNCTGAGPRSDLLIFRSVSYSSKELLTPNTTRDKAGEFKNYFRYR